MRSTSLSFKSVVSSRFVRVTIEHLQLAVQYVFAGRNQNWKKTGVQARFSCRIHKVQNPMQHIAIGSDFALIAFHIWSSWSIGQSHSESFLTWSVVGVFYVTEGSRPRTNRPVWFYWLLLQKIPSEFPISDFGIQNTLTGLSQRGQHWLDDGHLFQC